jgi:hypothetical protein
MDGDGMVEGFTDAPAMVTAAVLPVDRWAASVVASAGVVFTAVASMAADVGS